MALAVLDQLESSLRRSQLALLAHDIAGLGEATQDQWRWQRTLTHLWAEAARNAPADLAAAAVGAAQRRVLHLGRVQAALLTRERRWLKSLASLAAGPTAVYLLPCADDCESGCRDHR
jgi:hypothetical protein